jgi:phosphoribosyl 1,2-cyclic phosphodiesterase
MNNLNLEILGSSSKGNCYIIRTKDEVLILECGLHYKKILKAIKHDLHNVVGCLITHEHKDHSKWAKSLMDSAIDIYTSKGTIDALELYGHRANPVQKLKQFQVGSFTVLPFDVQHDAADPLGFLIYHPEFGKLLFATDTYYIKYKFDGLNYIMVECNYSLEIINKLAESGHIPFIVRKRLLKSHFSLENVKEFLKANDLSKCKSIMLMHLSDNNSNADLFKTEIEKLTGIPTKIC